MAESPKTSLGEVPERALQVCPGSTPMRKDLLAWFRREALNLAQAYEAAVRLLDSPNVPARIPLLAHVMREIYKKLPEKLDSEFKWEDATNIYRNCCDSIEQEWASMPRVDLRATPESSVETIPISPIQAATVWSLLEKHKVLRERPPSAEVLLNELFSRHASPGSAVPDWLVERVKNEFKWWVALAHRFEDSPSTTEAELRTHFDFFEHWMSSIVGEFFAVKGELDAIVQEANG